MHPERRDDRATIVPAGWLSTRSRRAVLLDGEYVRLLDHSSSVINVEGSVSERPSPHRERRNRASRNDSEIRSLRSSLYKKNSDEPFLLQGRMDTTGFPNKDNQDRAELSVFGIAGDRSSGAAESQVRGPEIFVRSRSTR